MIFSTFYLEIKLQISSHLALNLCEATAAFQPTIAIRTHLVTFMIKLFTVTVLTMMTLLDILHIKLEERNHSTLIQWCLL